MKLNEKQIRMIHESRPEFKGRTFADSESCPFELQGNELENFRQQFRQKLANDILDKMIEWGLISFHEETRRHVIFTACHNTRITAHFLIPNPEFIENLLPNLPVKP